MSPLNILFRWLQVNQILVIMIASLPKSCISPRVELFIVFSDIHSMVLSKLQLFHTTVGREKQLWLLQYLILKPLSPDEDPASLGDGT